MTRVCITGADSYIGTHMAAYLQARGARVQTLDVRAALDEQALTGADAVVHVAGIAHQKETRENAALYFQVNRDLTLRVAKAAKVRGVRQFVFLSSMSVYGLTCGRVTEKTVPAPNTAYGQSKLEAERALAALEGDGFHVAILRPPMIYGKGCKGNYQRLAALVGKTPVFPSVPNERSMLYIDCLTAFVYRLIQSGEGGLYFPQNAQYVTTDGLVREIAKARGRRVWQPRGFGWLLTRLAPKIGTVGKVFGTLTYDKSMSAAFADEPQPDFAHTIALTEET